MAKYVKATQSDIVISGKRVSLKPVELTADEVKGIDPFLIQKVTGHVEKQVVIENKEVKDYSGFTRDQLKEELKTLGIKFFPASSNDKLISLLSA